MAILPFSPSAVPPDLTQEGVDVIDSKEIILHTIEENFNKIEMGYSKYKDLNEVVKKFGLNYQKESIFQQKIQKGNVGEP